MEASKGNKSNAKSMQVQLLIEETKEWTRKCDPYHFTFFPLIDNKFFPFWLQTSIPFICPNHTEIQI